MTRCETCLIPDCGCWDAYEVEPNNERAAVLEARGPENPLATDDGIAGGPERRIA
jgi:hypothetical protein